jgi:hypothetical protein
MCDSDNTQPEIGIGVPFAGGSDDPHDLVGIKDEEMDEESRSEEGGDPGL